MGEVPRNKELVTSFFQQVWNKGNFDYMDEVYTDDFQLNALWQNTSLGRSGQASKEEARGTIKRWLDGFPDMNVTIEEQIGEDDFVASRHVAAGTHTAEFMGLPITGRYGAVSGITINRIRDDRIAEVWTCWDAVGMMQQLGILPAPDAGGPEEDAVGIFAELAKGMPDEASAEESKAIVRRFYDEVWNDGRLDVVDELFTPTFIGHAPGGKLSRGPQAVKDFVADWRSVVPDVEIEIHAQVAEGSRCATRFTGRGTHLGTWIGIPPTGKDITLSGISITRIVDGRFVLEWGEFDMMGLLQQLGVIETPARED